MKIELTQNESLDYFFNALCNGLSYIEDYGLELIYNDDDYKMAKTKVTNPSYEDVLIQILKDGGTLTLVDNEGGEDESKITIIEVYDRVQKTPLKHLMNMINENDDAETADVILQTVFLEDIVYG